MVGSEYTPYEVAIRPRWWVLDGEGSSYVGSAVSRFLCYARMGWHARHPRRGCFQQLSNSFCSASVTPDGQRAGGGLLPVNGQ